MPTYEYECKKCNYHFEVFQSISDEALKVCPQCGKEIRRLIFGGAGVIFKGSGFYVTDKGKGSVSKASNAKAPAAASKTAEAAQDASVSSKTGDAQKAMAPTGDGAAAANAGTKPPAKTA